MSKQGYSVDFRECVLAYLSRGHSIKSASEIFQISQKTINNWRSMVRKFGHCNPQTTPRISPKKIGDSMLLMYIDDYPDATLSEMARHFSCSSVAVWKRLKILKVTRKKNHALRGEKRRKKA
jgi:transposase